MVGAGIRPLHRGDRPELPDYEVKDVRQLVDWVAKRPEVQLDANGDPRVGIAGGSYGGAIALMAAAHDGRIDAIVPQITWYDLADALFPNATGQGPQNGVFKRMWAGLFFSRGGPSPAVPGIGTAAGQETPGGLAARPAAPPTAQEVRCGRFLPEICDMYQQVAQTGQATASAVETLRRSSPISVPGKIKIPTLLLQGQRDSLFTLGQADANARAIAATGAPVDVAWFDGGHDGGNGEVDWIHEETLGWFDRYLKKTAGTDRADNAFTVTRDGGRDPGTRRPVQLHATAAATPVCRAPARPRCRSAAPSSGWPARRADPLLDLRRPRFRRPRRGSANLGLSIDMAGQSAVFDSAPLTAPLQVTGSSTVKVRVSVEPGEPSPPIRRAPGKAGTRTAKPGGAT
ncbi:CocE/NonD family hydrolase [Streptosporangium lutulentum]